MFLRMFHELATWNLACNSQEELATSMMGRDAVQAMGFRIDRLDAGDGLIVLLVSGRLSGENVDTLGNALQQESNALAIDLKNVCLVDSDAVQLLVLAESDLGNGAQKLSEVYPRMGQPREGSKIRGDPLIEGLTQTHLDERSETMAAACLIGCSPKFQAPPEGLNEETLKFFDDDILSTSVFEEIVGSSEAIRWVTAQVLRVAPSDATVLITGESGTGKELIARAILGGQIVRAGHSFV